MTSGTRTAAVIHLESRRDRRRPRRARHIDVVAWRWLPARAIDYDDAALIAEGIDDGTEVNELEPAA